MAFFLIGLGATIWQTPMLAGADGLAMLWGVLFRIAVFLYVFAFPDAYFTAREMTAGTDAFIAENPRVAAILNLLTHGFGYFYLGQRAAGFAVFIGLGILQQMILSSIKGDKEGGALFMELILAGMAVHAYRIARKGEKEISRHHPTGSAIHCYGRPHPSGPDWFGATDWRGIHWTEWPRFFHARLLRN